MDTTPLGRGLGQARRTGEFLPGCRRASNEDYPRSAKGGARRLAPGNAAKRTVVARISLRMVS